MALRPLRLVCSPRSDVLTGGLTDNHFAAQLDKIVRDPTNYPFYGNPEEFFALTYPTSGLKALITKSFGRVTGFSGVASENGVLRSETSFGGGKTHGLTAIYHLARGARPSNLADFVDARILPDGPIAVSAIVGDALDPSAGLETNGIRSFTMWGEMAAQIGPDAVAVMSANERDRTAPSTHTIRDALGGEPTIVIIDEIAQHLRASLKSGSDDVRRYGESVPVFLKNLFEVAGDPSNRVSVIVTLASGTNAFGRETNEIAELLDESSDALSTAVSETQDVLARMVQPGATIKPAGDDEIGEILKRRLFETIDPKAARDAANAYEKLYEELRNEGEKLSSGAEHPSKYAAMVEKSYPFHPELVRVLDKRLGAIPKFQRARGALKLLSEVIAGIYRDEDDCDVINVADIDYGDEPVLAHLTSNLGRPEFSGVASVDLAGTLSHASSVDKQVFPNKPPYATRITRTVFTHSLEMAVAAGAGRTDWILGTMRPGDATAVLEKALTESERVCWHLSSDGIRWRFHVEPNINAILEEEKGNVQNSRVAAVMDDLVAKAFSNDGGAQSVVYPTGSSSISDTADLRVAIIDPNQRTVVAKDADKPDPFIIELLDFVGQSKAPRKYRNSLVFVLADSDQIDALRDRVRSLIASDVIASDSSRMAQFTADVQKKIERYQKNARLEARVAVTRCFKHVYYPAHDKAHSHLRHRDLPAQQQGETKSATSAVLTLLEDENKIKKEKPSFDWLKSKAWPSGNSSVSTEEISNWFWIDHGSPMIRNPALIREAVIDGIKNGGWVYFDSASGKAFTGKTMAGLSLEFRADALLMTHEEALIRGLLVRKPLVSDLREIILGKQVKSGQEIRTALEEKCGGEPAKGDVLEVISAALSQYGYDWIVVTESEPVEGAKALTPSQVKEKGLDSIRVLTREAADLIRVEVPGRVVSKSKHTASGPSGVALAQVIDKVNDAGNLITTLSIQTLANEQIGTQDFDLLISSLGMLQQFEIEVEVDLVAEFRGISGSLRLEAIGPRKDYQSLNETLSKVLTAATAVSGTLTVRFVFLPGAQAGGADVSQISTVMRALNIRNSNISAEVSK